jgi:hypothetical protein
MSNNEIALEKTFNLLANLVITSDVLVDQLTVIKNIFQNVENTNVAKHSFTDSIESEGQYNNFYVRNEFSLIISNYENITKTERVFIESINYVCLAISPTKIQFIDVGIHTNQARYKNIYTLDLPFTNNDRHYRIKLINFIESVFMNIFKIN